MQSPVREPLPVLKMDRKLSHAKYRLMISTYPNISLPSSITGNEPKVAPSANTDAPRTHMNENKKRPTDKDRSSKVERDKHTMKLHTTVSQFVNHETCNKNHDSIPSKQQEYDQTRV